MCRFVVKFLFKLVYVESKQSLFSYPLHIIIPTLGDKTAKRVGNTDSYRDNHSLCIYWMMWMLVCATGMSRMNEWRLSPAVLIKPQSFSYSAEMQYCSSTHREKGRECGRWRYFV